MALTILDDSMSSDRSRHTARRAPCMPSLWEVSWQPGRYLGRNEAITAMVLADTTASGDVHPGDRLWPHIQGWAQKLGLTAGDVVTRTACPPRWADKDAFWEFIDDEDRRTEPFMDYVTGHHRYEPGWLPDPSNANSCGLLQAGRDPQPDSDGPARLQAAPAPDKQAGWEAGQ